MNHPSATRSLLSAAFALCAAAREAAGIGHPRGAQPQIKFPGKPMSPTWIYLQAAIVVFVLAGMVIALVKLI